MDLPTRAHFHCAHSVPRFYPSLSAYFSSSGRAIASTSSKVIPASTAARNRSGIGLPRRGFVIGVKVEAGAGCVRFAVACSSKKRASAAEGNRQERPNFTAGRLRDAASAFTCSGVHPSASATCTAVRISSGMMLLESSNQRGSIGRNRYDATLVSRPKESVLLLPCIIHGLEEMISLMIVRVLTIRHSAA